MKKYNHQEYTEYLKKRDEEFEKFKIDFAKRFKFAFAQGKINWLEVGFIPTTPKYLKEYEEQNYLGTYMKGCCVEWIPDGYRRILKNESLPEKDKKIIEKEKELYDEARWGFLQKIKINNVTQGLTSSKSRRKKEKKNRERIL
tara:strand:+ start:248 stop:676 length:429 start_codon:yes stop_codon:yes gene_type:complete